MMKEGFKADGNKAEKELGLKALVMLPEGIQKTILFHREEG